MSAPVNSDDMDLESTSDIPQLYLVHSLRFTPAPLEDGRYGLDYVVLGVCESMTKAVQCADAHRLLDSTLLEMPTISVFPAYASNDFTIGLRIQYLDGVLLVQSRIMRDDDRYYVTSDENHYDALIEPSTLPAILRDAKKWHWDSIGGDMRVDYAIPDDALKMLDL